MSNHKKQKNANYSGTAGKKLVPANQANWLTRLFLGKTNILEQKEGKWQFPYALLAFLIPFIGGLLAMHCRAETMAEGSSSYIFSILYSDAYYQYYPFFVDFREILRSGGSLLYSWNVGMGTDYLGLFAYYVGSPLNWFSVLVPEKHLMDFYALLVPIRMGFAGLFFAIFLQKVFHKNDISIALFGSFYATCAWVTGYMWNTMWMDAFALVPLVILGTYNLLKYRKFVLYVVSLFFSIFINYYIGFFTCIFTLLVFIGYEICNWKDYKRFLADLGLMALFTVISIGMTALLSLPTFASLQTTYSTGTAFPKNLELHIAKEQSLGGFLKAILTVATNSFAAIAPNYKDYASSGGLPNIYCGTFAVFFSLLFLTCKQISWRERLSTLGLLLFINISFIIKQLDYIWHGFHATNAIPNRFSFLYSFILLYMAYRAWTLRRKFELWQIMVTLAVSFIGLFMSPGIGRAANAKEGAFITENLFVLVNLGILFLCSAALILYCYREPLAKKARWKAKRVWYQKLHLRRALGSLALVTIIGAELIFNIVAFSNLFPEQSAADYPRSAEDTAKAVAYMKQQEDSSSFYRTETAQHQSYNDGMLNGYNGISTFSSAANVNVTNYLKALGISAQDNYNRFVYEESSPVNHLFLNLKYILERRGFVEDNPYFTDVFSSGKVHLMKNNYYLPIGFMVDSSMKDLAFDPRNKDVFGFQNRLLSAALGQELTPYTIVHASSVTADEGIELTKLEKYPDDEKQIDAYNYSLSKDGYVYYKFSFDSEGLFCINYHMRSKNTYYVDYLAAGSNQYERLHSDTHNGLPYIGSTCQVYPGDQIRVKIQVKPGNNYKTLELTGALLDETVMQNAHALLSEAVLNVTSFEDTWIEGTIQCPEAGLLYTSIPQVNENWHVFVDGKEADITLIGDAMVGVMLEAGEHTVTFRYQNKAFTAGLTISIVCFVLFIAACGFSLFKKKKRNNA